MLEIKSDREKRKYLARLMMPDTWIDVDSYASTQNKKQNY